MKIENHPNCERSRTYRDNYLDRHKGAAGLYMCVYCGRIMTRRTMQVDHVIPVGKANCWIYWRLLKRGKNLNEVCNLVAACPRCNRRKSDKGGLWIVRGLIGPYIWPVIWAIRLILVIVLAVILTVYPDTLLSLSEMVGNAIARTIAWAARWITKL